jgi:hypothetical protein
MKKLVLSILAVPLLLPVPAVGQNHGDKSSVAKSITISGRVSQDGKSLIAKNGESWSVTNPDTLAAHQNQQVKVKCETSIDHSIRVLSVRTLATPASFHPNPSDSAFRR